MHPLEFPGQSSLHNAYFDTVSLLFLKGLVLIGSPRFTQLNGLVQRDLDSHNIDV